jgi:hypothetical protein
MNSRKDNAGSCGQKGMSNVCSTSLQASAASVCGRLPIPVVEKGVNMFDDNPFAGSFVHREKQPPLSPLLSGIKGVVKLHKKIF